MDIKEKMRRHNELENMNFRSDQEDEELIRLKEEFELMHKEQEERKQNGISTETEARPEQKSKGGSLVRKLLFVKPKEPPKPATKEEIEQLKLEAEKQEVLTRIAKAKSQQKNYKGSGSNFFESVQKVIGKSTSNPFDMSGGSSKKRTEYDPFRW